MKYVLFYSYMTNKYELVTIDNEYVVCDKYERITVPDHFYPGKFVSEFSELINAKNEQELLNQVVYVYNS